MHNEKPYAFQLLAKDYTGQPIKDNRMEACGIYGEEDKCMNVFGR
jgi:hypothetical protein